MALGITGIETMESPRILTIEWEMMDKSRFFPLTIINSFVLRGFLYPFTVIKTRLQVQKHTAVYKGTYDAFIKIVRYEGASGLYKGFWINTIQIGSGIGYIMTYEKVRHLLGKYAGITDGRIKGLIAGGCGSLVGQTIITPFDVVSQHMMILGQKKSKGIGGITSVNPLNIKYDGLNRRGLALCIVKELYKQDGLKGFYRGYFASLYTYVPTSGLWWMFYPAYSDLLASVFPVWTLHIVIHCIAGPMSGMTVSVITNPLDVVRARIQVHRTSSFTAAFKILWLEENIWMFTKGLSARMLHSSFSSFFIVLGYETLKRWSVYDQYKDQIKW